MNTESKTSFYLKWFSNLVIIVAAISLSFGYPELGRFLFLVGSICWLIMGILWREASLWSMNVVLVTIYVIGYLK